MTSPRADYHHSVREDLEMQDNYILPKQYPERIMRILTCFITPINTQKQEKGFPQIKLYDLVACVIYQIN